MGVGAGAGVGVGVGAGAGAGAGVGVGVGVGAGVGAGPFWRLARPVSPLAGLAGECRAPSASGRGFGCRSVAGCRLR